MRARERETDGTRPPERQREAMMSARVVRRRVRHALRVCARARSFLGEGCDRTERLWECVLRVWCLRCCGIWRLGRTTSGHRRAGMVYAGALAWRDSLTRCAWLNDWVARKGCCVLGVAVCLSVSESVVCAPRLPAVHVRNVGCTSTTMTNVQVRNEPLDLCSSLSRFAVGAWCHGACTGHCVSPLRKG